MSIFYGQTTQRLYGFVPYDQQDAGKIYKKHYLRYLILDYLSKNLSEVNERAEARAELSHCENVLQRWKLHPNWVEEEVLPYIERFKKLPIDKLVEEYRIYA
jgi:hypothetical protein